MTDTTPTPTPGTQTILKRFGATPRNSPTTSATSAVRPANS